MPSPELILYEEDLGKIEEALTGLRGESNAKFICLIDRNGQQLSSVGENHDLDSTSLASLTAGSVAATESLAKLLGEPLFSSLYHEGQRDSLHITPIGKRAILVISFDERSSLGLIRLRVRQAAEGLLVVLEQMEKRQSEKAGKSGETPFAQITDDDIDSLFAE